MNNYNFNDILMNIIDSEGCGKFKFKKNSKTEPSKDNKAKIKAEKDKAQKKSTS